MKHKKWSYLRMCILCMIYAVGYTFCLYRNYSGLTFPFFAALTVGCFLYFLYACGHTLKRFSLFLITAILLLSVHICLTASRVLSAFDRSVLFVLFFWLFLYNLYDDTTWDVTRYLAAIAGTVCSAISFLFTPISDGLALRRARSEAEAMRSAQGAMRSENANGTAGAADVPETVTQGFIEINADSSVGKNMTAESENMTGNTVISTGASSELTPRSEFVTQVSETEKRPVGTVLYVLLGLAISIPVVLVVLPLLLTSDAVFSERFSRLLSRSWYENFLRVCGLAVVMFFVAYMLLKRLSVRSAYLSSPVLDKRTHSPITAATLNAVLLALYLPYSLIQIIYLFLRKGTLPEGYTYADYVHEGFYQLVFVCLINLILVLLCRKYFRKNPLLYTLLCVLSFCTYIMIGSAAYRMALYIRAYHLTFLRLFVLWALVLMALLMAGAVLYLFLDRMPFVRYALVLSVSLWLLFAYGNPDARIARYDLARMSDAAAVSYVTCDLSADAAPAVLQYAEQTGRYDVLEDFIRGGRYRSDWYSRTQLLEEELTPRTFNYSKWRFRRMAAAYGMP